MNLLLWKLNQCTLSHTLLQWEELQKKRKPFKICISSQLKDNKVPMIDNFLKIKYWMPKERRKLMKFLRNKEWWNGILTVIQVDKLFKSLWMYLLRTVVFIKWSPNIRRQSRQRTPQVAPRKHFSRLVTNYMKLITIEQVRNI